MTPNHQQLIGLLIHAEPGFLAGDFATRFDKATGTDGQAGSFRYFPEGFWDVTLVDGTRDLMAPWGTRVEFESGEVEEAPRSGRTPPGHSPWSLVLPHRSTFLGREHDSWQVDYNMPVVEEAGGLTVALTNREDPSCTGTLTVNTDTCTISKADLGYVVETLSITRTEPNAEDLAALEYIRSAVPKFDDQDAEISGFAVELMVGLGDVGSIRVGSPGPDATVLLDVYDGTENVREYRFAQSLTEIEDAITIDDEAWHSMWPDWSLTAASVAMFSVHVQEAIDTAPPGAAILHLVPGGVIAVENMAE
ncbi:hypothetical protein ACFVTE_18770 [Arthrobacter sp. NPDC058097]|uniref:hypothetical protein n=1 Tax=Arthrobacter sp. NPDC058097 TaxID=3346340 RepID=UPI0036D891A2